MTQHRNSILYNIQLVSLYIYVIYLFIFFTFFQIIHQITIGAYSNIITKTERKHYLGVFQKSLTMSQNRKKNDFFNDRWVENTF